MFKKKKMENLLSAEGSATKWAGKRHFKEVIMYKGNFFQNPGISTQSISLYVRAPPIHFCLHSIMRSRSHLSDMSVCRSRHSLPCNRGLRAIWPCTNQRELKALYNLERRHKCERPLKRYLPSINPWSNHNPLVCWFWSHIFCII